jgi:uncharacterized protein
MHQKLPVEIEPLKLAKQGQILEGKLSVATLKRLNPYLAENVGEVKVRLDFGFDASHKPYAKGQFGTQLMVTCERCLKAMPFDIKINNTLGIAKHEHQVDDMPSSYEPWLIGEESVVFLADMVEDELILALPLVAKHDSACLPAKAWQTEVLEQVEEDAAPTSSPFDILASLKSK